MNASPAKATSTPKSKAYHPTTEGARLLGRLQQLAKGPLSFWFLNHDLERDELARQIHELKQKGFAGFFLHPRGGLLTPYGSKKWYDTIRFCIEKAATNGLEAWLYDEDPYPSGAAGGRVVLEHPELRASSLQCKVLSVNQPGEAVLDLPEGALVAAYLVHEGSIERIDAEAGLVRTAWSQRHVMTSYYGPNMINGSPHWRAETGSPHYRIIATVDKPDTKVIGFVKEYPQQNPWGHYTDLLNPTAVEKFLHYTHEAYARHLKGSLGQTVPGIFTDEGKLKGMLPWTPRLPEAFRAVCGLELEALLPHLAITIDTRTPYIRWAYREALAQLLGENFMRQMKSTCDRHDLLLTGHISPEEDPASQVLFIPGLMRLLAMMDMPGTDLIGSTIGGHSHPLLHLSPKLAASAAHATGKPLVACEAFAVADWSQDVATLTRAVHWLYALGVNRLVMHGQFYSIDGLRKREAPPSQFFQASYWEHFQGFAKSVERLSEMLSQGRHEAPVLFYYPEESFMALSSHEPGWGEQRGTMEKLRDSMGALAHHLLLAGYDFDLVDAELLRRVTVDGETARLGDETFRAVVVPGCYFCESSFAIFRKMKAAGIPVIFLEPSATILNTRPTTVQTDGEGWRWAIKQVQRVLSPVWASSGSLIGHKRITDEGPLIFLCNNDSCDFEGRVVLDFPGPYEVCDPKHGQWYTAPEELHLSLPAGMGVLIRSFGGAMSFEMPLPLPRTLQPLATHWTPWVARAASENCLILNEFRCLFNAPGEDAPEENLFVGAPLVDFLSPGLLHTPPPGKKGSRYFFTSFDWVGELPSSLRLVRDSDLGENAHETMEFFFNRTPLNNFTRRYTFDSMNLEADLASLVRPGRNSLLWVQHCLGKAEGTPWPYDAVRLFGGFHAEFPHGRPAPAQLTVRPERYECAFPFSPLQLGHSHYHGMMEYEADFVLAGKAPDRLFLRFHRVYETMEIFLNEQALGVLWAPPYVLEVDPGLLRDGTNRLTLHCSTSPANYLQGLGRPAGLLGPVEWCSWPC